MFKALATVFAVLFSGTLILSFSLQAMEIYKYDKMAGEDQGEYVVLLIEGAQKVLIDDGKRDLADKVHRLFTEIPSGDDMPLGATEFTTNLARGRLNDLERLAKDPNALRLEVEHIMIVTLKKNDIILPKSFMTVGKDFKPKHPSKDEKK